MSRTAKSPEQVDQVVGLLNRVLPLISVCQRASEEWGDCDVATLLAEAADAAFGARRLLLEGPPQNWDLVASVVDELHGRGIEIGQALRALEEARRIYSGENEARLVMLCLSILQERQGRVRAVPAASVEQLPVERRDESD